MGAIRDAFETVWRDYVTVGVPASGDHEAVKADIRAIGALVEQSLSALSLGSVTVAYATQAELNADLAHPVNSVALVYADPTDANNDLYVKVGASGSGSWALTAILRDAASALVAAQVDPKVVEAEGFRDEAEGFRNEAAAAAAAAEAIADPAPVLVPFSYETAYETRGGGFPVQLRSETDPRRYTLAQAGFAPVGSASERRCYNAGGVYIGTLLQDADSYVGAPWNDPAAPHTSGSPAYLTTTAGGSIAYAGAHSEPDIFGGTGGGVLLTQSATANGFHTANNVSVPTVAGDLIRYQGFIRAFDMASPDVVQIRGGGTATMQVTANFTAAGVLTSVTEQWASQRNGFVDGARFGKPGFYFVWGERRATGTGTATIGIGYGTGAAQAGRKILFCDLTIQKNPKTAPAAVPVCGTFNFEGDKIHTGVSERFGFILHGVGSCRSLAEGGVIVPPAIEVGISGFPLCTEIELLNSTETVDRVGVMPNENETLYYRPFGAPTNFVAYFGPGFWPRNWLRLGSGGDGCVNANVKPVFENRVDLRSILGPHAISVTFLTGEFDASKNILLAVGEPRTKYMEQSDVLAGSGASFDFVSDYTRFEDGLAIGGTLHSTRFRRGLQLDDTREHEVRVGELAATATAGGAVSLRGSRAHGMARTVIAANGDAANYTANVNNYCATRFWMDGLFVGRGNLTSWEQRQSFTALTVAHVDTFVNQSERPVRISADAGVTWADLSPSFNPEDMPAGYLAEHVGVWDFINGTLGGAPNPAKKLRVRYWEVGSITSPVVQKPGFQWVGSQMDMGSYSRWPENGDVFRIKRGSQWIDVTFQGGEWRAGGYTRYTGGQVNLPMNSGGVVSNDHVQVNRTLGNALGANVFDGCVMIGPKGAYFLTGDPGLAPSGTGLNNFEIRNTVVLSLGTNALRWDWSDVPLSKCYVENALIIEARSKATFVDGTGWTVTSGAAGPNNILEFGPNVTMLSSSPTGSGILAPSGGATHVGSAGVKQLVAGRRSNYTTFTAPGPEAAHLVESSYDPLQGRPLLPRYEDLFRFNVSLFGEQIAGFPARAVVEAAQGDHERWNPVIEDIESHWCREPDHYAATTPSAAVGTVLATGVTATAFHRRYGGNFPEQYFEIVGGELRVARPLTGVNRIFPLRGNNDEMFIVDVKP